MKVSEEDIANKKRDDLGLPRTATDQQVTAALQDWMAGAAARGASSGRWADGPGWLERLRKEPSAGWEAGRRGSERRGSFSVEPQPAADPGSEIKSEEEGAPASVGGQGGGGHHKKRRRKSKRKSKRRKSKRRSTKSTRRKTKKRKSRREKSRRGRR